MASNKNLKCFMHGLKNPTIHSPADLARAVDGLERVVCEPREVHGRVVPNKYQLVGERSGNLMGDVTHKYALLQDSDAIMPVVSALEQLNQPMFGHIERDGSITRLALAIGEAVQLNDSPYYATFTWENSFDGSRVQLFSSSPMRAICGNGMHDIAGVCFMERIKHLGESVKVIERIIRFFDEAQASVIKIVPIMEQADSEQIRFNHLEQVLRGSGLKKRDSEKIYDTLADANNDITKWTAYNGVTGHFSNRLKGNYETNLEGLRCGAKMLQTPTTDLYMAGQIIMDAEATASP